MRRFLVTTPLVLITLFGLHCYANKPVNIHSQFPARLSLSYLTILTDAKAGRIHIVDESQNRTLIRFNLKDTFVTTRRADDQVSEKMAAYTMRDETKEECNLLQLLRAIVEKDAITLTGRLQCGTAATDINLKFVPMADRVLLKVQPHDIRFNRVKLRFLAEDNEAIFGGGEQFSHLNLRGHRLPMLAQRQGFGGTDVTTSAPIPFFFTSAFRSIDAESPAYQVWDFTGPEYTVEVWDNTLALNLATADSFEKFIAGYTARTGRIQPLPDWAAGTILGVQGGKEKVEQILNAALAAGNPVTAICIQDWTGRRQSDSGAQLWWRWSADEKAYPDFRNWVRTLALKGIRVLGYVNPFLADEGPLFEEARKQGFLLRNRKYEPYKIQTAGFPAYLIDLSNPKARNFIKGIIRDNLLAAGFSGYMADFGEWLPWDSAPASGEGAALWHNRYPVEWAQLNREAIREAGLESRVVFFTRAGFTGSAAVSTLFWAGDQLVTFDEHDGLASAITGILTGGISGISLNHADIGGYTTVTHFLRDHHRSRELLLRSAEFAVFTPFFRTQEGSRPEKNYQVWQDEKIVREFAELGKTHLKLKPYIAGLMREAAASGLPLLRPLLLHYPADRNTYNLKHQAMLGRDLIVAPVIEPGATSGSVYLPKGSWIESSTGRVIATAGWHTFPAPLGKVVGFIRAGSAQETLLKAALSPN